MKVYALVEPLNLICLGPDFSVHLDYPLFETNRPKYLYWNIKI